MLLTGGKLKPEGSTWGIDFDALDMHTCCDKAANPGDAITEWIQSWADSIIKRPIAELSVVVDGASFTIETTDTAGIVALVVSSVRSAAEMSQRDLATAGGWRSHSTIGQYESGKHDPTMVKLQEILGLMGMDLCVEIRQRTSFKNRKKTA